jgi:hypothetical protein
LVRFANLKIYEMMSFLYKPKYTTFSLKSMKSRDWF